MALISASIKLTQRPKDQKAFEEWTEQCLLQFESVLNLLALGHLPKTYVAPDKPYEGMVRHADGTHWDPGLGQGAYMYYAGAWNKLG